MEDQVSSIGTNETGEDPSQIALELEGWEQELIRLNPNMEGYIREQAASRARYKAEMAEIREGLKKLSEEFPETVAEVFRPIHESLQGIGRTLEAVQTDMQRVQETLRPIVDGADRGQQQPAEPGQIDGAV